MGENSRRRVGVSWWGELVWGVGIGAEGRIESTRYIKGKGNVTRKTCGGVVREERGEEKSKKSKNGRAHSGKRRQKGGSKKERGERALREKARRGKAQRGWVIQTVGRGVEAAEIVP